MAIIYSLQKSLSNVMLSVSQITTLRLIFEGEVVQDNTLQTGSTVPLESSQDGEYELTLSADGESSVVEKFKIVRNLQYSLCKDVVRVVCSDDNCECNHTTETAQNLFNKLLYYNVLKQSDASIFRLNNYLVNAIKILDSCTQDAISDIIREDRVSLYNEENLELLKKLVFLYWSGFYFLQKLTTGSEDVMELKELFQYNKIVDCACGTCFNIKTLESIFNGELDPVTSRPVISLLGDNPLVLNLGETYEELGAIVQDSIEGDLSSELIIDSSDVDIKHGSYQVLYNAQNAQGYDATEVVRTVQVGYQSAGDTINEVFNVVQRTIEVEVGSTIQASIDIDFQKGYIESLLPAGGVHEFTTSAIEKIIVSNIATEEEVFTIEDISAESYTIEFPIENVQKGEITHEVKIFYKDLKTDEVKTMAGLTLPIQVSYKIFKFFGTQNTSPKTSNEIRDLDNRLMGIEDNYFYAESVPAGIQEHSFYVPDNTIIGVTFIGAINVGITSEVKRCLVTVKDANGTDVVYTKNTYYIGENGYEEETSLSIAVLPGSSFANACPLGDNLTITGVTYESECCSN